MSSSDDFVHIFTATTPPHRFHPLPPNIPGPTVANDFFTNSKGDRTYTEAFIVKSIRAKHPKHHLTVTPGYIDLLTFAASREDITYKPHGEPKDFLTERQFQPPARRYGDESGGSFAERVVFGCFDFKVGKDEFLVYTVEGSDGMYKSRFHYVLYDISAPGNVTTTVDAQKKTDEFLRAAFKWMQELHGEVLVFDNGFWQKNKELWENVQKSKWEDVILEKEKKDAIIEDVIGFFDAEKRYNEFGVPWKRGVIFYGPPGNGKTISTKALMHDVSQRISPAIESLYVKSFSSFQGPEYGIRQIFLVARLMAPCLLIFEDIDSLVNPLVRSYFLNEVDGLESNHGILMIGSTNHLERLDPGIAKRPSRFDRKYLFDVPTREERVKYAEYWRYKLRDNKQIEFPKILCEKVADITNEFSFAYMKEAFVAALLSIVRGEEKKVGRREEDLSGNLLWKELRKQIESLRKEMGGDEDEDPNWVVKGKGKSKEKSKEREIIGSEGSSAGLGMSGMWEGLNSALDERRTRPMEIHNQFNPHRFYNNPFNDARGGMDGMPRYF